VGQHYRILDDNAHGKKQLTYMKSLSHSDYGEKMLQKYKKSTCSHSLKHMTCLINLKIPKMTVAGVTPMHALFSTKAVVSCAITACNRLQFLQEGAKIIAQLF